MAEVVVAAQSRQRTQSDGVGEENLRPCVNPYLQSYRYIIIHLAHRPREKLSILVPSIESIPSELGHLAMPI